MSKVYINGTLRPIFKAPEVDFDPVRGIVTSREVHSAGDNLAGWYAFCIQNRIACRWKKSPVVSTLQMTWSGATEGMDDAAQTQWELAGNELQYSILEGAFAHQGESYFPFLIKHVKLGLAALQSGDQAFEEALFDSLETGEDYYYNKLLNLLLRGASHFPKAQYVLRRMISVSNYFAGNIPGESNSEKILSTGAILSMDMPTAMKNKINSIPMDPVMDFNPDAYWGWRQLASRMVTGAQNRMEVSTEWWLAGWDTFLYQVA